MAKKSKKEATKPEFIRTRYGPIRRKELQRFRREYRPEKLWNAILDLRCMPEELPDLVQRLTQVHEMMYHLSRGFQPENPPSEPAQVLSDELLMNVEEYKKLFNSLYRQLERIESDLFELFPAPDEILSEEDVSQDLNDLRWYEDFS